MTENNHCKELFENIKIKDVMKTTVIHICEDDEVSEAQIKFINHRITHLVVVDRNEKLSGILSQKYLYKTVAPRKLMGKDSLIPTLDTIVDGDYFYNKEHLDSFILKSIMNKNPSSMTPEQSLAEAIIVMAKKKVACIPIVDAHMKVVGVITDREVVKFMAEILC